MWDPQHLQPYRPPWSVTGIDLFFMFLFLLSGHNLNLLLQEHEMYQSECLDGKKATVKTILWVRGRNASSIRICMRSPTKKQPYPCYPFLYVRHASSSTLCRRANNPSIKETQISCFCAQRRELDQEGTREHGGTWRKMGDATGEIVLEAVHTGRASGGAVGGFAQLTLPCITSEGRRKISPHDSPA
jgi:hypothetical protein